MKRTKRPVADNDRVKRRKLGGIDRVNKAESFPSVARDGANPGDILVGTSKTNFGLAIQLLTPAKPIARRAHLSRAVEEALDEKINITDWSVNAAKHFDWPIELAKENQFSDEDFIRIVSVILESEGATKQIAYRLKEVYKIPNDPNKDEDVQNRAKDLLNYSIEHACLPLHACLVDVKFHIIDPGSGTRSSTFRQLMEEAQAIDSHPGFEFDDISQKIQQDTGYNKATFFLNFSNLRHPNDRIYSYEDEVGKNIRLQEYTKLSSAVSSTFPRDKGICYVLLLKSIDAESAKESQLDFSIECKLLPAKEFKTEGFTLVREWSFPKLPGIQFFYCNELDDQNDDEVMKNSSSSNTIKVTAGILKSLLQKQVRRGHAKDAVITSTKISQLPTCYNPQYHTSSSGLASLLQRLIVIIIEDVGYTSELSPICWMAQIAAYDQSWQPNASLWRYIRKFVYQMSLRKDRQIFHKGNLHKPYEIKNYIELVDKSKYKKLNSNSSALALGIELRCREPGMLFDRKMMRSVTNSIVNGNIKDSKEPLTQVPLDILEGNYDWSDEILCKAPYALDFHAYPAIVDRIFEESAQIYVHYLKLSKQQKKVTSVDKLRSDMWDFSSGFNFRDGDSDKKSKSDPRRDYWKSVVEPVFHLCVQYRLKKITHN